MLNKRELIEHYFNRDYSYDVIVAFLEIHHDIVISKSTLKRRLRQYGLKRRSSNISFQALRAIIQREIEGPNSLVGYRGMWNHLKRSYGIRITRNTIMTLI